MSCRGVAWLPLVAGVLAAQSGTVPKAGAEEYPVHAKLEKLSIGAEYLVHSFSGGRETFIARDYLVVEVALFPAPGQSLVVNAGQFSLRMNGRKQALAPQAPQFVAASLKYPDWSTRPRLQGGGSAGGMGPVIFGAPAPVERFPGDPEARTGRVPRAPDNNPGGLDKQPPVTAEELAVEAALPEEERHSPVSGYLYFAYHGKTKHIHKLQLEYAGPAGSAVLPLI